MKKFLFCLMILSSIYVYGGEIPLRDTKPKYESLTPIANRLVVIDGTVKIGYGDNYFSPNRKDSFDIKPIVQVESRNEKAKKAILSLRGAISRWFSVFFVTGVFISVVLSFVGVFTFIIVYFQHWYMEHKKGK